MPEELVKVEKPSEAIIITAETVKKYICAKATDSEIGLFLNITKSYNLNPFKREIHLIKYGDTPASIVVGYEVYIKRAERTGKLDGWKVRVEGEPGKEKAVIEIKRKDFSEPFQWEVSRAEFDKGQASWKSMPLFMLKKVAIGQGFRLCFSEELGGMPYLKEEIDTESSESLPKAEIKIDEEPVREVSIKTSSPTKKELGDRLLRIWGQDKQTARDFVAEWFKKELKDLTPEECVKLDKLIIAEEEKLLKEIG